MRNLVLMAGACLLIGSPAAAAQRGQQEALPPHVQQLLACRTITDEAQRLACFDRQSAAVGQAIAARDIVMVDREKAREASRSLFGFKVPDFGGIFGGGGDEVREIETSVEGAGRNAEGGWTVRLADGSTWSQTDDTIIALPPRKGHKATIRRGTLGAFYLRLNNQPGVRVRRIG